jgi:hypothetical protein
MQIFLLILKAMNYLIFSDILADSNYDFHAEIEWTSKYYLSLMRKGK